MVYHRAKVIRRKLKSMFILKHEFDFKEKYDGYQEWEDARMNWLINEEMALKFGSGVYYSFEPISDGHNNQYTHTDRDDGYYYHESWFIEHRDDRMIPIIKLDEEDFLL